VNIIEYIEKYPSIFFALILIVAIGNGVMFYLGGKKANKRFHGQSHQRVLFIERGASGRSHKSCMTKLGGARNAMEVVVTESELWIKGIWPIFSYIGSKFDLTHRIRKSDIKSCEVEGLVVKLWFHNESGT
jgi:hypothetical protein